MEIHGNDIIRWTDCGGVFLTHATGSLPDDMAPAFIAAIERTPAKLWVATHDRNPHVNSVQRKMIFGLVAAKKMRVLAITDNSIVRGIATAAGWLGADVRAYAWSKLDDAMRDLSLDAANEAEVRRAIQRMRQPP